MSKRVCNVKWQELATWLPTCPRVGLELAAEQVGWARAMGGLLVGLTSLLSHVHLLLFLMGIIPLFFLPHLQNFKQIFHHLPRSPSPPSPHPSSDP